MSDDENGFHDDADVGFKNGSIRLEEMPAVYYPGQTMNGSVIFDLRRPLSFHAIHIRFIGEGKVLWTEIESVVDQYDEIEREVKYQSNEVYFDYTKTLAGGFGSSQLPRTYQNFPFNYQIPFNVPSSFEGEKGSVKYTIIATMLYPDMSKEELTKDFTVVAPLDLNVVNPRVKEPIDMEFDETVSCCFSSSPVNIRVKVPVAGYCPGQTIPVAVETTDESGVEITKMVFEIVSRELYRSNRPPSEYILPEIILTSVEKGAVLPYTKRNFTVEVPVPDMIVPYLEHCNVIDIRYYLRIIFQMSGWNDDIKDETEILLGLVPIKETVVGSYVHPMAHLLPSVPIPVNNMPDLPPIAPLGFVDPNQQTSHISADFGLSHPPPYPGTAPYPTGNSFMIFPGQTIPSNVPQGAPYSDDPPPYPGNSCPEKAPAPKPNPYDIGFKVYSPYPSNAGGMNNTNNNSSLMYNPTDNAPSAPPPDVDN